MYGPPSNDKLSDINLIESKKKIFLHGIESNL